MGQSWRTGRTIKLNVYAGDTPVCQCHTPEMAARIVEAVNRLPEFERLCRGASHTIKSVLACRQGITDEALRSMADALDQALTRSAGIVANQGILGASGTK